MTTTKRSCQHLNPEVWLQGLFIGTGTLCYFLVWNIFFNFSDFTGVCDEKTVNIYYSREDN